MKQSSPWSSQGKPAGPMKSPAAKPTPGQMNKWEGSPADNKIDKQMGYKEGSAADKAADKKGAMTMPTAPAKKPYNPAANLGAYHHPPKAKTPVPTSKIGPNTTAPVKARSVTAGPNGSFPVGDTNHAKLAIPMATRSERAGNITPAQAATIKAKAKAMLSKGK